MIFPKNVTFICMFQKKSVSLQFVRREKHILTRRTYQKTLSFASRLGRIAC